MNPIIHTLKSNLKCVGLDPKSAHPLIYLTVKERTKCPYCSVEYVLSTKENSPND